jgi:hypothetical protein
MHAEVHAELVGRAGRPFGLLATAEKAATLATLGDVVAWIVAAEKSPVVVNVWSPRCSMCKGGYDERVTAILSRTGARMLAVTSGPKDDPDHVEGYLEGNGWWWLVALDADQTVVKRLGATRTPHCYVLDAEHVLRYSGAVDNDFLEELPEGERKDWLEDAIEAVKAGREVGTPVTEANGCPIRGVG